MRTDNYLIALFGEAERGNYQKAYFCDTLEQLVDYFGNPPASSRGIHLAIQALMYHRSLIFFRVKEEGFSLNDYYSGLKILERDHIITHLEALGLPGVGDTEILDTSASICQLHHSILITSEADFYDFLTQGKLGSD